MTPNKPLDSLSERVHNQCMDKATVMRGDSVLVRTPETCGDFGIPAIVLTVDEYRCDVRIGSGEILNVGLGNIRMSRCCDVVTVGSEKIHEMTCPHFAHLPICARRNRS